MTINMSDVKLSQNNDDYFSVSHTGSQCLGDPQWNVLYQVRL